MKKTYIEKQLQKKITPQMENKHKPVFDKQARYKGNGVYFIPGTDLFATDTRDLFLMFVAAREGIKYKTQLDETNK